MSYLSPRSGLSVGLASYATLSAGRLSGPAIDLDLLTPPLSSAVVFTRATNAGYFGSNGLYQVAAVNQPRFDYNPLTFAARGLLIEPQEANISIQSEAFNLWTQVGLSVTPNNALAPNGATTADTLVENAAVNTKNANQSAAIVSGQSYWLTCFASPATQSWFQLAAGTGTFGATVWANFNTTTGAVGNMGVGVLGTYSQQLPSGLWRFGIRCLATATTTAAAIVCALTDNADAATRAPSFLGQSRQAVNLWGGSVVASSASSPGTYIPTVASAVTRNADAVIASSAGLYNQTTGTLLFIGDSVVTAGANAHVVSFDDGTSNNGVYLLVSGGNLVASAVSGGVTLATLNLGAAVSNTRFKVAFAWNVPGNRFAASINGAAVVSTTLASLPAATSLSLSRVGTNERNGHSERLSAWTRVLLDSQLIALTA